MANCSQEPARRAQWGEPSRPAVALLDLNTPPSPPSPCWAARVPKPGSPSPGPTHLRDGPPHTHHTIHMAVRALSKVGQLATLVNVYIVLSFF